MKRLYIPSKHQNIDSIDYDEDEDLSTIIAKIEGEYNSSIYDHHLNTKQDKKKIPRTSHPNINIKKEEDHIIEIAFSARTIQEYQTYDKELSQCIPKTITHEELKRMIDENEMLANIEENKETLIFA